MHMYMKENRCLTPISDEAFKHHNNNKLENDKTNKHNKYAAFAGKTCIFHIHQYLKEHIFSIHQYYKCYKLKE